MQGLLLSLKLSQGRFAIFRLDVVVAALMMKSGMNFKFTTDRTS